MTRFIISILITGLIMVLLTTCTKLEIDAEAPSCIEKKIRQIKRDDSYNPPAQVWEWKVDDNIYYYFTSDCCDQLNYLYDTNCNIVCAPDGGFTGAGDGNCPDFGDSIGMTLIWEDDR